MADRGMEVLEVSGMEADDLLASIAKQAKGKVVLVTSDKDCRQCLEAGRVSIINKVKINYGKLEVQFTTEDDVAAKYGVTADQWIDFQAMVGDKVDNIEGVEGVGESTAAKILSIGTLDEILKAPERCPVSKRIIENLHKFRKRVIEVRLLVTLKTDVEVGIV